MIKELSAIYKPFIIVISTQILVFYVVNSFFRTHVRFISLFCCLEAGVVYPYFTGLIGKQFVGENGKEVASRARPTEL
ncbi:hypothetical protein J5TS2_05590 [Brevibacillus halotolerans]|uniref:Uncharacterized protein n=1 Tax=Brevibacillus laterosporus TaxID=1465 RepID=A0A0F6Y0Y6_BRELA|nr:hypothetical protein EX87_22745 [Brevibacillus laterosporus]GIN99890.1 hypothetical protein J5TS2_05590 [Brevibacillus halotolerans]